MVGFSNNVLLIYCDCSNMKCHYAVLGVPINADDDVIKKAYRKKALKWHPDKNIENSEEATEKFRLVQAAYDVLSDPQEKAWYDRHRNDILHRSNFASFEDETSDILDFFTPSVYRGYGDNEKGFFTVYRELFKKISMEDKQFHMSDSDDEFEEMPEFGEAESGYDEVVHLFYSSWQSYRTKLSYVWKDKYNARDAPDRRIARIIEKENKKEREKEKRKRNDLIRDLVAFVRKRDPRVKIHREELERKAELQSKKASEKRAEIMRLGTRLIVMNRDKMMEDATRVAQLEDLLKDEFGFSSSEESEEEWENEQEEKEESGNEEQQDELYCVACNKQFKTKMALKNHEKSKKHREKFVELQAEMSHDKYQQQDDTATVDEATNKPKLTKKQKKQRKQKFQLLNGYEDDDVINPNDVINPDNVTNTDDVIDPDEVTDDVINNDVTNTDDVTPPEVASATKKTKSRRRKPKNQRTTNDVMGSDITNDDITKQRSKNQHRIISEEKPTNFCSTCRTRFPTRNKLFQHLKTTGHSKPLK
ncbi:Zn-finger (U1-like)-8 [Ciona intestinalis]